METADVVGVAVESETVTQLLCRFGSEKRLSAGTEDTSEMFEQVNVEAAGLWR